MKYHYFLLIIINSLLVNNYSQIVGYQEIEKIWEVASCAQDPNKFVYTNHDGLNIVELDKSILIPNKPGAIYDSVQLSMARNGILSYQSEKDKIIVNTTNKIYRTVEIHHPWGFSMGPRFGDKYLAARMTEFSTLFMYGFHCENLISKRPYAIEGVYGCNTMKWCNYGNEAKFSFNGEDCLKIFDIEQDKITHSWHAPTRVPTCNEWQDQNEFIATSCATKPALVQLYHPKEKNALESIEIHKALDIISIVPWYKNFLGFMTYLQGVKIWNRVAKKFQETAKYEKPCHLRISPSEKCFAVAGKSSVTVEWLDRAHKVELPTGLDPFITFNNNGSKLIAVSYNKETKKVDLNIWKLVG